MKMSSSLGVNATPRLLLQRKGNYGILALILGKEKSE